MQYIKIQFTLGLDCIAYQEIDSGMLVCIKDQFGGILDTSEIVTESFVVDDEPMWLDWMIP